MFYFAFGTIDVLWENDIFILTFIYQLATLIPSIAVTVRRLHDTDRTGLWYFIIFVPFIGSIILLILMLPEGNWGDNQYGPDPVDEG
jgi:uncharacterized membrane protein YhaH (DUF805 family)